MSISSRNLHDSGSERITTRCLDSLMKKKMSLIFWSTTFLVEGHKLDQRAPVLKTLNRDFLNACDIPLKYFLWAIWF